MSPFQEMKQKFKIILIVDVIYNTIQVLHVLHVITTPNNQYPYTNFMPLIVTPRLPHVTLSHFTITHSQAVVIIPLSYQMPRQMDVIARFICT